MENNQLDTEQISLNVNQSTQIDLIGLGTAGYQWTYKGENLDILKIEHSYITSKKVEAGGQGIERFSIIALKPGKCLIEFKQARSWEKDKKPLREKKYIIEVH